MEFEDPRVKPKYEDSVMKFEIGLDVEENSVVKKFARKALISRGYTTEETTCGLATIEEAADEAREVFRDPRILLFLGNAWRGGRCLEGFFSFARWAGSCVFSLARGQQSFHRATPRGL